MLDLMQTHFFDYFYIVSMCTVIFPHCIRKLFLCVTIYFLAISVFVSVFHYSVISL